MKNGDCVLSCYCFQGLAIGLEGLAIHFRVVPGIGFQGLGTWGFIENALVELDRQRGMQRTDPQTPDL